MREDLVSREHLARISGPQDVFTQIALSSNSIFSILSSVLLPVQIVTTAISGCLIAITLGLLVFPLTLIWQSFSGFLLATSFGWIKIPLLRPVLIVPGLLIALVAQIFVQLTANPDGPSDRYIKLLLCNIWPLSWLVLHPPHELYALDKQQSAQWVDHIEEASGPYHSALHVSNGRYHTSQGCPRGRRIDYRCQCVERAPAGVCQWCRNNERGD